MQLSKIKLCGFKSFVDPTVIDLSGQLIAIVGPNGCGKSNIIDAVTWVMGESSPKYLRGEALTDVIFNGSNGRKPVGQASVELIFDNSDGSIGGEYAKYSEISIKRQINRDSDSSYYINNTRCRKRDVVDIFLGTGLGPRSYSIIGQNMISKMAEEKDLRPYLEEAAGISKYKERRHETELRIGHTKENIARVNDVGAELEKQLGHLKHQANVAEKYKTLKQQERTLRSELYSVQWRELDNQMANQTLAIQREETTLQAHQSELITTDQATEQLRQQIRSAQDVFQEVQRNYYSIGNDIGRLEQEISHHQSRQAQWMNDLKQVDSDCEQTQQQIAESEDQLEALEHDIQHLMPQFSAAQETTDALQEELVSAEETMQVWQQRWDEFNQSAAKINQTAQVTKTHLAHLEQRITMLKQRETQLRENQTECDGSIINNEIAMFNEQTNIAKTQLETLQFELDERREYLLGLQTEQREGSIQLDQMRSEMQKLLGQQASLEALQQTALGQRDQQAQHWAETHDLAKQPRLAQHIKVTAGWENAAEKVLGFCLQAICVEDASSLIDQLADFEAGKLCAFSTNTKQASKKNKKKGTLLLEQITSPWPLDALLGDIYIAETQAAALALCESLEPNESVITKDGIWLNRSWIKILREDDPAAGVFQREQELNELRLHIQDLENEQEKLIQHITLQREQITQEEAARDQLQQKYHQQQSAFAELNAQQKAKQDRLTEVELQTDRLNKELTQCLTQLVATQSEYEEAQATLTTALAQSAQTDQIREGLIAERETIREQLYIVRNNAKQKSEAMHELEIRLQTAKSQKQAIQQTVLRLQTQLKNLDERKMHLEKELTEMPLIDSLQQNLSMTLDKHVKTEAELRKAREEVEILEQAFNSFEEKRQHVEREMNKVRNTLERLRVEWQGWKVKADTINEQIQEMEINLEEVLKTLPDDIRHETWQAKLDQTIQRINRLGPINLVAIEEYATCLERKTYLDKQLEDLQAGLTTLEDAIAKIDKETRSRFKETFDKVDARFQELFPLIFGGGKAYLELSSDDLLTANVTMMACPPGKRNSSIYLLSGGEKSLTAIALIFSIFHLNPAPFCLLDEVDAALDDANVVRFTRIVKAMADKTQFFFISHNKITIEMGEYLLGVTMNEPGVSRLVSVDIEKAMDLAGAA